VRAMGQDLEIFSTFRDVLFDDGQYPTSTRTSAVTICYPCIISLPESAVPVFQIGVVVKFLDGTFVLILCDIKVEIKEVFFGLGWRARPYARRQARDRSTCLSPNNTSQRGNEPHRETTPKLQGKQTEENQLGVVASIMKRCTVDNP
jgi:hypothetical protein